MRCGYVSREAAEKYYGAVFRPGATEIDVAATAARRDQMRRDGLPKDEPVAETDATVAPPAHDHHHHEHAALTEEERVALAMSGRCCS